MQRQHGSTQPNFHVRKSGICKLAHEYVWPEPYIYTVYDRVFGDFPANYTVYTLYIYMVVANPTHVEIWLCAIS
jgi:hypothetical protein